MADLFVGTRAGDFSDEEDQEGGGSDSRTDFEEDQPGAKSVPCCVVLVGCDLRPCLLLVLSVKLQAGQLKVKQARAAIFTYKNCGFAFRVRAGPSSQARHPQTTTCKEAWPAP